MAQKKKAAKAAKPTKRSAASNGAASAANGTPQTYVQKMHAAVFKIFKRANRYKDKIVASEFADASIASSMGTAMAALGKVTEGLLLVPKDFRPARAVTAGRKTFEEGTVVKVKDDALEKMVKKWGADLITKTSTFVVKDADGSTVRCRAKSADGIVLLPLPRAKIERVSAEA